MILLDVNVLGHAHREDALDHARYARWLEDVANGDATFGLSEFVLSGFIRIVTHPRIFTPPTPLADPLAFVESLRERPTCVSIGPGPRHWQLFTSLCRRVGAKGNIVP